MGGGGGGLNRGLTLDTTLISLHTPKAHGNWRVFTCLHFFLLETGNYDIPRTPPTSNYDIPRASAHEGSYDVPRSYEDLTAEENLDKDGLVPRDIPV